MRYSTARERERAKSIDRFYHDLFKEPASSPPATRASGTTPGKAVSPVSTPGGSLPKTEREEVIRKAQVVFGSRLAGPIQRRRELDSASVRVAGILVPPRPDEPDNCCMSGCVNCVWDRYRDELEEWAEKSSQARHALQAQRADEEEERARTRGTRSTPEADMPAHVANSMDDDGGGSEALWTGTKADKMPLAPAGGDDLFAGVPVGIREFMRTEKKLKELKEKRQKQKIRE